MISHYRPPTKPKFDWEVAGRVCCCVLLLLFACVYLWTELIGQRAAYCCMMVGVALANLPRKG